MAVSEQQRHQLFRTLEERLGGEEASTMMELLPPVGWADVATKQDLDRVELRISQEIGKDVGRIDRRLESLEQRLDRMSTSYIRWMLAGQALTLGWVTALVQLS